MSSGADAVPDAPTVMFQPFTSTTWSLAMMNGAAQLSITDGSGPAACALSVDQQHTLGAAGVQIIVQLAGTATDTCPVGQYPVTPHCDSPSSAAYVTAGCAFYRRWDASGHLVGITSAINGEVSIFGGTSSCTVRANIGFLGGSFAEMLTLMNGAGMQPWCGT
jgi:hypothetical protein